MFLRLLWESFVRQRRRKALAGIAILLGTTAVTAMLALALSIGDRIHNELAVYGANIVVTSKADSLEVKVAGLDLKPATGGNFLEEKDLDKLKTIFWANNITGVSPENDMQGFLVMPGSAKAEGVRWLRVWFHHPFGAMTTGAPALHPWWKLNGRWPADQDRDEVVIGRRLAEHYGLVVGQRFILAQMGQMPSLDARVTGIISTGDASDDAVFSSLEPLGVPGLDRVEISARTRPEDAFAREDPDTLSPAKREIWYCRPYANSIAYQIREAIPGSQVEQVRRVEQTEGTVLSRISGLMWLISAAALLAAGFAVSAAMATAVMERRAEIGLMRSLGATQTTIALLFYAESAMLAVLGGTLGYLAGSALAWWLGHRIFPGDAAPPILNAVLLPVVVALALVVAVAGSTSSIRAALRTSPSDVLRGGS